MIRAAKPKGSRGRYIAWLAPNAYAISWEIDKNAMGSRLRFPIRRRSVTDRKARSDLQLSGALWSRWETTRETL